MNPDESIFNRVIDLLTLPFRLPLAIWRAIRKELS